MANQVDMTATYYRKALLPEGLSEDNPKVTLKHETQQLLESMKNQTYSHSLILMSGLRRGKTANAAALLRGWIAMRKDIVTQGVPALFLPVHALCYQNRTVDRYNRDAELNSLIRNARTTDFLVLDGVFSYLTQNDDLLLQSIYDARQYCCKTTIVTTSVEDPTDCAGSVLFRIARDANIKVVF